MIERTVSERSVFEAAIEKGSPEERAAYLDQACGSNKSLRQDVEALLAAHDRLGSFHPAATVDEPISERPGTVIGPYKLLEQIGEGGFGVVFMAEQQQPLRRKVALKVLKPGMDTRQVVARFEAERQALALMDHPNIARVIDGGTTGGEPGGVSPGRPYFVMELVKGLPMTEFCDQHQVSVHDRLELFVSVCQAVQHAHQKGVIHRDLKPSNVLVTLHDGTPLVKVIDFGIAKATGQQLTDKTLFTGFAQMVGTPLYMAPEQAALSNVDVDTRSDIYSLGVLLYELLTGATPFDKERLQRAGYDEMRRILREEEPPKPSTRMSTVGQAATTASAKRGSDPRKLSRLFRGELDWIVMKALEKDRGRRYETANGMAMDVQRYLADEPVLACPPSASYRLRKVLRRHKGPVLAASAILFLLVTAIVGTSIGLVRALDAERQTRKERDDKDAARRQAVAAAEAEADARRQTRQALNTLTDEVIKDLLGKQPQLTDKQREFLQKILALHAEYARAKADDPEGRHSRAEGFYHVGQIQQTLGETLEAERAYRESLAILRDLVAEHADRDDYRYSLVLCSRDFGMLLIEYKLHGAGIVPSRQAADAFREGADHARVLAGRSLEVKYRFMLANCERNLAAQLYYADQSLEAESLLRDALAIDSKLADQFPDSIDYRAGVATGHEWLRLVLSSTNRPRQASEARRAALENYGKLVALYRNPFDEYRGRHYASMGVLHVELSEWKEAEKAFRQAVTIGKQVAKEFPARPGPRIFLAMTLSNLGMLLHDQRKVADAEEPLRDCLELFQKLADELPRDPDIRCQLHGAYHNLGVLMHEAKRLEEAETLWRQGLIVGQKLVKEFPNNPGYRHVLARHYELRAQFLSKSDRLEEAETCWRHALEHYHAAIRIKKDDAESYNDLGTALARKGQVDDAIAAFRQAIQIKKDYAGGHYNLGKSLNDKGEFEAAIAAYRQAIRIQQDFTEAYYNLGIALGNMGRSDEAITALRQALQWRPDYPEAHVNLGNALRDKGLLDDAIDHYQAAIATKQVFPEAYKAYIGLGVAFDKKGQLDKAIAAYHGAIRIEKDNPEAHLNLGNALHGDEAIAEYREALRLKKDYPEAHYSLGIALVEMGRLDEAIAAYREAIRLKKDYAEAYGNLGVALAGKGQLEEAIAAFRQAIRIKNDDAGEHYNLGKALSLMGRFDEAIAAFREAIRLKKDYAEAHYDLGMALIEMGRLDEAIAAFREAIRIKKDYAEAHYNLGNALRDKGKLDDAIAAFRHAIQIKKDFAEAHCNLGHALRRQGEFREALKELRRGHELGSRNPAWPYRSAEWVRQCERLVELDGMLSGILDGKTTPASPAERIELARLCSLKRLNAAAFRFYEAAIAAEPKLADDPRTGLRYDAACAAALAGCGQGKDADNLEATERAHLRGQALDWLRAELKANGLLLEKDGSKAGPAVAQQMRHWLDDPDFAGVRGPEALAKLPEAERPPWQKLWQDVADLLKRAQEKTQREKK
jgi:tetratricopeptide (TPR) repeat protein